MLGWRTYEDFYGFWPKQTGNPFTEVLDSTRKYVASTTLAESLPWSNSTLLEGDAADAVAGLKQQPGEDLPDGGGLARLRLTGSTATTTSVLIATYQARRDT